MARRAAKKKKATRRPKARARKKKSVTYVTITGRIPIDEGEPTAVKERLLLIGFAAMLVFIAFALSNMPGELTETDEITAPEKIFQQISSPTANPNLAVVREGAVDPDTLEQLSKTDYQELKKELGVKGDFAIYFVDEDNNLLLIGDTSCIGSPEACGALQKQS